MSKKDEQKELKKKVKEAMKIYNKKEDEEDLKFLKLGLVIILAIGFIYFAFLKDNVIILGS